MAMVIRGHWASDAGTGLARRDRRSCDYDAYVPDLLTGRPILLSGDTAADVSDAERAIAVFDAQATSLLDTEALARVLLRAESVASSRIEGLEAGARRLLRAEAAIRLGERPSDITATEVLANIDAMAQAVRTIRPGGLITLDALLSFHERLLAGTRLHRYAGSLRSEQNWIGGSSYNPCTASFVPPPPEFVHDLLVDLCDFCNTDSLPAVAQAAIAHAQFETIHPFVDGNGRTGRALVQVILRRRGLATDYVPPISVVLAADKPRYLQGLVDFREGRENDWLDNFANAAARAAELAAAYLTRVQRLQDDWREAVAPLRLRSDAAAWRVIDA